MFADYTIVKSIEYYEKKLNRIMKNYESFIVNGKVDINRVHNTTRCSDEKCKKLYPNEYFIDKYGKITKKCLTCREIGRIKDNREQRKQSKAIWKENNHDKTALYWMNYRGRQRSTPEKEQEYLDRCARVAREWREKNPDKMVEANEKKRKNVKIYYNIYKKCASDKNLDFELTEEEYYELVQKECYYCNEIQEKGFNGLDRVNCRKGYIKDNCVPCCEICNFIKGSLEEHIFIRRVEHILSHQGLYEGKLYPECFANHYSARYDIYEKRANKKILDFKITREEFKNICLQDCYICGKKTDDNHVNGIDRIDNNKGYEKDNVKACCGECNFMKNKFDLNVFYDKLKKILDNKKDYIESLNDNNIDINKDNTTHPNLKIYKYLNKKSKDELKEESIINKEKKLQITREKYNDEEYKLQRANELKEKRANMISNKKNNNNDDKINKSIR